MRLKLGNLTIRNLIITYILLYSIMPIVARLTSRYLTTYFYMIVVVTLVLLILVLDRPENLNLYGSFLLPFLIYGLLTRLATNADMVLWGYQTLLFWLPVILGYYFVQDESRVLPSYSKLIILAIIITMITTIIGCIQFPNAAREIALLSSQDANSTIYDMRNIGGYSFVYCMVLLYPLLILSYKTERIHTVPTIVITLLVLFTVIYSEYTTALLLFIITSFLFFTKRNLSAKGILVLSVVSVLFLFVFSSVIVDFLHWLGDVLGSETMGARLDALAGGTSGLRNAEDNRIELYQISINTFLKHPLFGYSLSKEGTMGGHSFILDSLANYGVVGGVMLFLMYRNIFVRFFMPFKEKLGFGYIIWTFIQTIILSIINTGMFLEVICLFVPILLFWVYGMKTEAKEVINEDTVDSEHAAGSVG